MTSIPAPADAARLSSLLHRHPRWSVFWDKRYGVWRVAEDDPDSAAVICEDIERSCRDTFNALKLEKKLSRSGIPLFATDEPAHIDGINATTVLVRRMKQGVAEWFRLQLKEKTWKGLVEHSLDG